MHYLDTESAILSGSHGSIIGSARADAGFTVLRSVGQDRNEIGRHRGQDHLARFTSQTMPRSAYVRSEPQNFTGNRAGIGDSHEIVKRIRFISPFVN